ncbi:hypothetical protein DFQ26_006719 [Actinomortierella ambigua]|nr:hypothetical protein DFQ26_006719 [Actinomortierella ambigua]
MAHLLAYSRVPFWKMPEHRLPTLGLYRQILKTVLALPTDLTCQPSKTGSPWRTPTPKPPTTKKASASKTVSTTHEQDQPQQEEIQQLSIPLGPPGSHHPLPSPLRPFLFAWIRDRFRACQHCTSKRITARYLIEAEELLEKLEQAKRGDNEQGRLKENDTADYVPRMPFYGISQERDARDYRNVFYYKIHLSPDLFSFPLPQDTHGQDLSIYPTPRPKNQRGKFKNSGGPYLTAVLTAHGSRFPRLRGGTLPPWMGAMFRKRMRRNHRDVDEWKLLEEWKVDMECEEELYRSLGVEDYGYDRPKDITED